jgi:MFS family permease
MTVTNVINTERTTINSAGSDKIGLLVIIISTLITSTSMGMLAVLVPVHLSSFSYSDSVLGAVLSFETIASLIICLLLPSILRHTKISVGIISSSLFRIPTILLFPYFSGLGVLAPAIFIHAVGCYYIFLLLQIWVNYIPFKQNKGLMIALYSTAISMGLAIGPILVNYLNANPELFTDMTDNVLVYTTAFIGHSPIVESGRLFVIAMLLSACSVLPLFFYITKIPTVNYRGTSSIFKTIMDNKGAMFSISMAGVSQFGVGAFIIIYGMKNGLSLSDSALLLTSFMLGSLILEIPIAWLSDYFDRRFFIVGCSFASMIFVIYLPIAIYTPIHAWILVFLWGGVIAGIYSLSLTIIGEKYTEGDDFIASNAGYSLMESIGGTLGIVAIGASMHYLGTDGMPYVIMFSSILYFSFALTRYPIE